VPVGGLARPAAVELFADRARAVRPGFVADGQAGEVVEDICRRLDGLPLAVELAAARLRALPLAILAERLGDRFRLLTGGARTALPRQQTLRAVVDWSYDLLFEDERRLFARLAAFTGGCDLTAAEAVCADEQVPSGEILDALSRLVDKSLVTISDTGAEVRFGQLHTLWQYGRERLGESGEGDATSARHGAYYRQMAEEAYRGLRGPGGPLWRDRLVAEAGNLRAALDWYIAAGDADAALSLTSGMAWLWFINADFTEGARWLGDALGAEGPRRPEVQATARLWHGYCVGMSTSPAAGVIECEEAVAALRTSDDQVRLAEALVICATVLGFAHHLERSLDVLAEARDLLEPAGHGWLLGVQELIVAWNLLSLGRLEEAEPVARSSLERFDAAGEVLVVVSPLNALASIAEARGDLEAASVAYEALVERCRATGQPVQVPFSLVALAALRARQGDDAAADGLYAEAIGCSVNAWVSADAMVGQAAVARRLGDLPRARALLDAAGGHYRHIDLPAGPPRVLAGLAWWALAVSHLQEAASFAADAAEGASASGDPATQLLADTAIAAVKVITRPTRHHIEAFIALARRRAQGPAYRSLTDEPDVTALAARLALSRLQDDAAAVPWPAIEQVLRSELGAEVSEVFASFDRTPIAAASIAQVHAATLRSGARVVVKVRRPDVSQTVDRDLASGNPAVDPFPADMSSQAEVRRLAREVLAAYPRLDVLVNNVGGFWATRCLTADGLERTFAVNHLAPFLLTYLLTDRLTASAPARIVTVSSGAHATGKINFDDLQGERRYSGQQAYSQSKLANVLFTYELARRLDGTGVTATAAHPGVVRTGFAAEDPAPMWKLFLPLIRLFLKTPQKGAATSIYLASSPEVDGVTGTYFAASKPKASSPASHDTAAAARLWQISLDLVARTA